MTAKLLEPLDLASPHLPGALEGMRVAHLSDLHITRRHPRQQAIVKALANQRLDLVLLTGDYMNHPGDEQVACEVMGDLLAQLRPSVGCWGVFGNHDTPRLVTMLQELPVTWLKDQQTWVDGLPLRLLGLHHDRWHQADAVDLIRQQPAKPADQSERPFTIALSHYPTLLPTVADLGVDVLLAGHTHGGQCRLPTGHALVNSCDYPLSLTSGLLRHQDTLCVVSRGLGEVALPLRMFCRPHIPLYTLRRGPLPGEPTQDVRNVRPW